MWTKLVILGLRPERRCTKLAPEKARLIYNNYQFYFINYKFYFVDYQFYFINY